MIIEGADQETTGCIFVLYTAVYWIKENGITNFCWVTKTENPICPKTVPNSLFWGKTGLILAWIISQDDLIDYYLRIYLVYLQVWSGFVLC
jgi:hypothetical protein